MNERKFSNEEEVSEALSEHASAIEDLRERTKASSSITHANEHAWIHQSLKRIERVLPAAMVAADQEKHERAQMIASMDRMLRRQAKSQRKGISFQIVTIVVVAATYVLGKKLGISDVAIGAAVAGIVSAAVALLSRAGREEPAKPPGSGNGRLPPFSNGGNE